MQITSDYRPPDPDSFNKMADELATHLPREIRRAIDELPLKLRSRLLLNVIAGYTEKELAEMLGITQVAVNHTITKAKAELRELLQPIYKRRQ